LNRKNFFRLFQAFRAANVNSGFSPFSIFWPQNISLGLIAKALNIDAKRLSLLIKYKFLAIPAGSSLQSSIAFA
jgi:hypothetical protein